MSIYKRLGLTREDLALRPWREVQEIYDMVNLLDQEEAAQMASANAKAATARR